MLDGLDDASIEMEEAKVLSLVILVISLLPPHPQKEEYVLLSIL